jgi:hypothetical protein
MLRAMLAIGGKNPSSIPTGAIFCVYVSGQPLEKHLETIKHLQDREKFILPQDRRI